MTQGAFIAYLEANDCYIYKEIPNRYYKWRNSKNKSSMSGLPIIDNTKELRPFTICQVCHSLSIDVPDEVKYAEEVVTYIRNSVKNNQAPD